MTVPSGDNAKSLAIMMEELLWELSQDDWHDFYENTAMRKTKDLADSVWNDCSLRFAKKYIQSDIDFSYKSPETNYTLYHIAAAMGRKDLFDLFCEAARPDTEAVDALGRSPGDLAMMLANDPALCEHVHRTFAQFRRHER
ncbi:hypothetical protein [Jiella mangrovi]|uniref:Ankyrin repeat domain-containing protein n=1 Tax=Jiella mangrovi TaxID=2821407 RepID=A0ABS4BG24_9HYPH|nr:hypothetical protein [Jiella mangrovi]MBP0615703.1 hypothetical protein [Jiella mangrovi]